MPDPLDINKQITNKDVSKFLDDVNSLDRLAVAADRGNKLATEGFGKDLLQMSYGQLKSKYNKEVADKSINVQRSVEKNYYNKKATRSPGQIISDSFLDAESAFTGFVGGAASLGLAGASKLEQFINPNSDLISPLTNASTNVGKLFQDIVASSKDQQSTEYKNRERLQSIESQLDKEDLDFKYKNADDTFVNKLQKVGESALNTADRVLNDPAIVLGHTASALGSLGPSAIIAKAASKAAVGVSTNLTTNAALQRAAATVGAAGGVGLAESSGIYNDTVNAVTNVSYEELLDNSEQYRKLLDTGLSKDQARNQLAVDTGIEAFNKQLPVASVLGLISSKFETAPIGNFKGSSFVEGLRTIGTQTLEEGLQGGTGSYNKDIALKDNIDPNINPLDNVGEEFATGAIAGLGMASTLATPSLTKNVTKNVTKNSIKLGKEVLTKSNLSDVSSIKDKVSPIVKPIVKSVENTAKLVGKPIKSGIENLANKTDSLVVSKQKDVTSNAIANIKVYTSKFDFNTNKLEKHSEKLSSIKKLVFDTDETSKLNIPKSLSKTITKDSTLIDNVIALTENFNVNNKPIKSLPDEDIIYASNIFKSLEVVSNNLPTKLKTEVDSILHSSNAKSINKLIKKIDLNTTQDINTKVSTKETLKSIEIAKSNPSNVNPEFISKLLKHSDRKNLSNEDVKFLSVAAKIAKTVDNHIGQKIEIYKDSDKQVQISKDRNQDQSIVSNANVSRSIQIGGFTDGKRNKLRSINDFASDIFIAGQSPDNKFINNESITIKGSTIAKQFTMFATHMKNKVEALNKSYDSNNERGFGKSVYFDSLVGGNKILIAGDPNGSRPVAYHKSRPGSVTNARAVYNDAVIAVEVHNLVLDTFPDLFSGLKLELPILRLDIEQDTDSSKSKELEPVEKKEKETNNTTAVEEEVLPQANTSDELDQSTEVIENKDEDQTSSELLSKSFVKLEDNSFNNSNDILNKAVELNNSTNDNNIKYIKFMKAFLNPIGVKMNNRLKTLIYNKDRDEDTLKAFREFKNLTIVNSKTQQYDPELLKLATIGILDWMTYARPVNYGRQDKSLQTLNLKRSEVSHTDIHNIMNSIPVAVIAKDVSKQVLKLWNHSINKDVPMVDAQGAVEGVIKELLTIIVSNTKLADSVTIPIKINGSIRELKTVNIAPMLEIQRNLGLKNQGLVQKLLLPELDGTPSIDEKVKFVSQTQNRTNISLSELEKKAIKSMQDTPHTVVKDTASLIKELGFKTLSPMLGYKKVDHITEGHPLRKSIQGKNLSIKLNYDDSISILDAIESIGDLKNTPIHYKVGISRVGRHQFKGINPQNNKILRSAITPTHATLDMTNDDQRDLFWLTISQASKLNKPDSENHQTILKSIQVEFNDKYGNAVKLIENWITNKKLDKQAFKKSFDDVIDMTELDAVIAVAQLNIAKNNNTEKEFKTSLAFELDGKTDGPGNMMVNFGQGLLTKSDFQNFNRIGFFLGQKDGTLNKYYDKNNIDIYEAGSQKVLKTFQENINTATKQKKKILYALANFTNHFGDTEINEAGEITMTRNLSKNPITQTSYGAGAVSVSEGLSEELVLEFYKKMAAVTDNKNHSSFLGYPTLKDDFKILFGEALPVEGNWADLVITEKAKNNFSKIIKDDLGIILSNSAQEVLGNPINQVNELLVFITNFQAEFLSKKFQIELDNLIELRAQQGKISRNTTKEKKGISRQLTQNDYNDLIKKMDIYSSRFSNKNQTLSVSSLTNQVSDMEISSNMEGEFHQKSIMLGPENPGVRVIPYLTIGRGDAMVMNLTFGSSGNVLNDTVPLFDGFNIPVDKIKTHANHINKSVLDNWDQDILIDVVNDFESFLKHADDDSGLLLEVFNSIRKSKGFIDTNINTMKDPLILLKEAHRQNSARKSAFKRIPLSVDHIGGSDTSYSRDGLDNIQDTDFGIDRINEIIQEELDKTDPNKKQKQEDTKIFKPYDKLYVTTGEAMISGLIHETKNKSVNQTVRLIKNNLPKDLKVITGSLDQLKKYHKDTFGVSTNLINSPGQYDSVNNTIYVANNNHETITHELVHASTFNKILDHYENNQSNDSVIRLEKLMEEFLGLNFSNSDQEIKDASNAAKEAIILHQTNNDNFSKAAAINEFMAWTLTNEHLIKSLKTTRTGTISLLTKKVIVLMKRIMGNIPSDIFSNIIFNTKLLNNSILLSNNVDNNSNLDIPDIPDITDNSGNGEGNNNDDGEITPPAHNYTNFWIDLLKERLTISRNNYSKDDKGKTPEYRADQAKRYSDFADNALGRLNYGGFTLSEYQQHTYKAIHMVLSTEMKLNPIALKAMNTSFNHVVDNLKPEMFKSPDKDLKYSTVMELFGATKNDEKISDAIATLLALSQTSKGFRHALDQLPKPESNDQNDQDTKSASLNSFLSRVTTTMMNTAINSVDVSSASKEDNLNVKQLLDVLSENLIERDAEKEFYVIRSLMSKINKADTLISDNFNKAADYVANINQDIQKSDRSTIAKITAGSISLVTNFLSKDRTELSTDFLTKVTHMGSVLDNAIPAREFVSEMVGTNSANEKVVQLLDKVNKAVTLTRQKYVNDVPVILQNLFNKHPDKDEWKLLHQILGKNDLSVLYDINKPEEIIKYLSDDKFLQSKIDASISVIRSNSSKETSNIIISKSKQLARDMNNKGAGHQLWRNAYAINVLSGEFNNSITSDIDNLISMYALQESDINQKKQIADMYSVDSEAIQNMLIYLQGLNLEEDIKSVSEEAKLNGFKGYIPDDPSKNSRIIIEDDTLEDDLVKRGFVRIGDYTAEDGFSKTKRGYYFTRTKQNGSYSQGVMQTVRASYRGVDVVTGASITNKTFGLISNESANVITDEMNKLKKLDNDKEALLPLYDKEGHVQYYERAINPDILQDYTKPESNLALMLGSWAGRQIEEKFAQQYNFELIDNLKDIYDKRKTNEDKLFLNLADKDLKDKIYKDSWNMIPPGTKEYIKQKFDNDTFMVRKDMINLSVGYRDPSIIDMWSGNTRLPETAQTGVKAITQAIIGDKGLKILSATEDGLQSTVSSAKDLIVVRSLIVPYMNIQANFVQLSTVGVGTKDIVKGSKHKLLEIEEYNKNLTKLIELDLRIQLSANDANKVSILEDKIQVINDYNSRMSIAPLIEAGAYKNISEGITEMDIQLTSGRFGEWVENTVNRLPAGVQIIAKYGLVSKDTALYKGANKAIQYGDFIAKSILYDHLTQREKNKPEEALKRVNEEFVNFSPPPGRLRSGIESYGGSWFMTFKIKITKIAMRILRENPLKALIVANTIGDLGSPVEDNLINVIAEDRLKYPLGWDMLLTAPELNPWVNASEWASDNLKD